MGKTIYEKILARVSGRKEISPGDIIWAKPDLITPTDQVVWGERKGFFEKVGVERLVNPDKVVVVVDHCPQVCTSLESAENLKYLREWIKKYGVSHFYDIGRSGLTVQILVEKGYVRPGMMVIMDDTEAETCSALGAFLKAEDIFLAMALGEFWFKVPEIVRCNVAGSFGKGVMSIDLRQRLLGDFGEMFGKYIEFVGPTVDEMSIDARMSLCSNLYLCGGHGIIGADQKTIEYVKGRTKEPFEVVKSDLDAQYADVYEYDVSDLEPQIAFPPSPNNVKGVAEAEGMEIDEACIGACTSGRMEDLRAAAKILKGRKVHPRVRMFITPTSQEIYLNALREGLLEAFVKADAIVVGEPGCGTCFGYIGNLAAGEVCVATHPVNYPGRMGSAEAKIYLASPATVAASAVEGKITDPRKLL